MMASRPLEFVCFFPLEIPTRDKGDIYFFTALDMYSNFLFNIGVDLSNDNKAVLKNVNLLMENEKFKLHRDKGFTLVFHKYAELQKDIEAIINPYGGKMIINDPLVAKIYTPVMHNIFKGYADFLDKRSKKL